MLVWRQKSVAVSRTPVATAPLCVPVASIPRLRGFVAFLLELYSSQSSERPSAFAGEQGGSPARLAACPVPRTVRLTTT